jgi:hypothetical protein
VFNLRGPPICSRQVAAEKSASALRHSFVVSSLNQHSAGTPLMVLSLYLLTLHTSAGWLASFSVLIQDVNAVLKDFPS